MDEYVNNGCYCFSPDYSPRTIIKKHRERTTNHSCTSPSTVRTPTESCLLRTGVLLRPHNLSSLNNAALSQMSWTPNYLTIRLHNWIRERKAIHQRYQDSISKCINDIIAFQGRNNNNVCETIEGTRMDMVLAEEETAEDGDDWILHAPGAAYQHEVTKFLLNVSLHFTCATLNERFEPLIIFTAGLPHW